MPILRVEIVGPFPEGDREGLPGRIAESAAAVLGSRPGGTWVRVEFVPAGRYAENGDGAEPAGEPAAPSASASGTGSGRTEGPFPVLVSLLLADPPPGDALATLLRELTRAIADECARPAENVHIILEPPARGRISFGGELRS